MMGIDDIAISFVVSYIAGSIPTFKDYFANNTDLKGRIDKCYDRAVEKWAQSFELQNVMKDSPYQHLNDLCAYIQNSPEGKHPRHHELMQIWANELRNDELCYNFIIEQKENLTHQKLDKQEKHLNKLEEMLSTLSSEMKGKNKNELKNFIETLLKENISELIEHLHYNEANKIIQIIEESYLSAIKDDPILFSEFEYRKGQILGSFNLKESISCLHHSYELYPKSKQFARAEAWNLFSQKKIEEAKKVMSDLSDKDTTKQAILISLNKTPKEAYISCPDDLKNDYSFRQLLLQALQNIGKMDDIDFLFPEEELTLPKDLNHSNLNAWFYILNHHRMKIKDAIIFTRQAPIIIDFHKGYEAYDKFFTLLAKTDLCTQFKGFRAFYCYWGFFSENDETLLAEYQNIDGLKQGAQKYLFVLIESAMLLVAKREQEAFATIVSIQNDIEKDDVLMSSYTNCLVLMSLHSSSLMYLNLMFDICKEVKHKIDTETTKSIAMIVSGQNAADIKSALQAIDFVNPIEKNLLVQLCNYMLNINVNLDSLTDCMAKIDDTLLAFGAMILSANGKDEYAYNILNSKIDKDKIDLKQRIFLDVLTRNKTHHPELYRLLQKNRKNGFDKEDILLVNEFNLALKLADMSNALEIITILYKRHPEHEFEFVNMIMVLGQVNPEELAAYEKKALAFEYTSFQALATTYKAFASNNYAETAVEILYKNLQIDEERVKTFFYLESTMGAIHDMVNKQYEKAEIGQYVLIEYAYGDRKVYRITSDSPLGIAVIGKKANDIVEVDFDYSGKKRKVKVIGIFTKYFKVISDFMLEMRETGGNATFKPMTIDMEHPLKSLEDTINKMDPDNKDRKKRQSEALQHYADGSVCLLNLVNDNDIVGTNYKLLFSQFKVYVLPVKTTEQLFPVLREDDIQFVLDLPGLIMLFEFSQKYNVSYHSKFILPKFTYEYLKRYQKTVKYNIDPNYYEAFKSGNIKLYSKFYDADLEQRIQELIAWAEKNCELRVDETALAVADGDRSDHQLLFSNTMTQILKSKNFLITDDTNMRNFVNGMPILSTESYMYFKESEEIAKKYTEYLLECGFIGLNIDRNYIFSEYMKLEHNTENHWLAITMNAERNPFMFTEAMNAGIMIIRSSLNFGLMRMSLTNLFAMSMTRMSTELLNNIWQQAQIFFKSQMQGFRILKECLMDARQIVGR